MSRSKKLSAYQFCRIPDNVSQQAMSRAEGVVPIRNEVWWNLLENVAVKKETMGLF
jgi:hypothetical protein